MLVMSKYWLLDPQLMVDPESMADRIWNPTHVGHGLEPSVAPFRFVIVAVEITAFVIVADEIMAVVIVVVPIVTELTRTSPLKLFPMSL